MFKCKNCNTEIHLQNKGVHAETLIVLCPRCHTVVEASSCYGFGPVWPACIYCGDRLVAEIKKTGPYRDNNFELCILGEKVPFPLSDQLRKENYKRHFEICDLIIDLLRERNIC